MSTVKSLKYYSQRAYSSYYYDLQVALGEEFPLSQTLSEPFLNAGLLEDMTSERF